MWQQTRLQTEGKRPVPPVHQHLPLWRRPHLLSSWGWSGRWADNGSKTYRSTFRVTWWRFDRIRNEYLTARSSECLCLSSFLSQIRETDTRTERPAGSSAPRSSQVREPSRSAPVTPSRRGTGFFRGRGCSPCPAVTRSPGLFHRLLANTVNMNVNDINLCLQAVSEGETYNEYMGCNLSKWINMAIIWL